MDVFIKLILGKISILICINNYYPYFNIWINFIMIYTIIYLTYIAIVKYVANVVHTIKYYTK